MREFRIAFAHSLRTQCLHSLRTGLPLMRTQKSDHPRSCVLTHTHSPSRTQNMTQLEMSAGYFVSYCFRKNTHPEGLKFIFPINYFQGYPGIARIKIHKAIDPDKLKDVKKLNTFVHNIILNELTVYGKSE